MSDNIKQEILGCSSSLCVIGAPGTGKTTFFREKILSLLSQGINPDSILALSSSLNNAEKISKTIEEEIGIEFRVTTYDLLVEEIIKNHNYHIFDEYLQYYFFLNYVEENNLSTKYPKLSKNEIAKEFQRIIALLKFNGVTPETLVTLNFEDSQQKADLLKCFAQYEQYKNRHNYYDREDMMVIAKTTIEKKSFSYVIADDFEEINQILFEIITSIGETTIVFGENTNSYYRDCSFAPITTFCKEKNPKIIRLHQNFRSNQKLVETFNNFIYNYRDSKELLKPNTTQEGIVSSVVANSQKTYIVETITSNAQKKIGILCRTTAQIQELSKTLNYYDIQHTSPEIENPLDHPLVKEIMLLLKTIAKPREENICFYKLLESLPIKEETLLEISRKTSRYEKSYYELLKKKYPHCENTHDNEIINQFFTKLKKMLVLKQSKLPLKELVLKIIREFNYYKKALIQGEYAINQINDFVTFSKEINDQQGCSTLKEFVEFISHIPKIPTSSQYEQSNIFLTSFHHSRDEEFDIVIIPHCCETEIPKKYKPYKIPTPYDITEEIHSQRENDLFFSAITRAKEQLHILYIENTLSPYITSLQLPNKFYNNEIPSIEQETKTKKIEEELIEQIIHHLHNRNFVYAKQRMELFESIFSSSDSLKKFIGNQTKEFEELKQKLPANTNSTSYDFTNHIYSVSQLKTYQQCPKKYLYQYVYKIPTPSKPYFDFGTTMHSVLEHIKPEIDKGLDKNKAKLRAFQLLSKYWISNSYHTSEEEQEYFELAVESIKNYIEKEFVINDEHRNTLYLEKKFYLSIDDKKIIGFIDRIDDTPNGLMLYDYKTSKTKFTQQQLQEDLQLYTYALALQQNNEFHKKPYKMAHWYLNHDAISSIEFDEKKATNIKKQLQELISQIEKKDFTATPSQFKCKYCDFNTICPFSKAY